MSRSKRKPSEDMLEHIVVNLTDTDGELRWVAIPHAGAGAAAFRRWIPRVPRSVSLTALRLPGRERLISEQPLAEWERVLDILSEAIARLPPGPFVLYGHCSGAIVAFELARRIQATSHRDLAALAVGGCEPPDEISVQVPSSWDRELPEAAKTNAELVNLLLPALKADFGLMASYRYQDGPRLLCPILALGPLRQHEQDGLGGWARQTAAGIAFRDTPLLFDGSGDGSVAEEVMDVLAASLPLVVPWFPNTMDSAR
jgi:medium-chain acyl-[acyl-carrier-protein] hydrolase